MRTMVKTGAVAAAMSLMSLNEAFAKGFWSPPHNWCPTVPEFDGPGAIAAAGLLASIVAVVYHRARG